MVETYDLMQELVLLDPKAVRLFVDAFDDLHLEMDGQTQGPLQVQRAFPLSADGDFIGLKDKSGVELGLIRRIDELDRDSRTVLEAELERVYFVGRIVRIDAIESRFHVGHWRVETDRGQRNFEVGSSRRGIRSLEGGRVLVTDADGNRYEIVDYRQLDPASRVLIEGLL